MKKKILVYLLIGIIILGIGLRIVILNNPYSCEETDFVKAAEGIKNTGIPTYYFSEQKPQDIFLLHPPMYVYLSSLFLKINSKEIGMRSVNFIFTLLTIMLVFLGVYRLFKKEKGIIVGLISSALFSLTYYAFQSSMIVDIDMLSTFFITLFIFSILIWFNENKSYFWISTIALFFAIANRFIIAGLIYCSILIFCILNKNYRNKIKDYILLGIVSCVSFIAIWWAYSKFIVPGTFFSFLKHNLALGGEAVSNPLVYMFSFVLNLVQIIQLITIPAFILLIMAVIYCKKDNLIKIILYSLFFGAGFFVIIARPAFGYPRYFLSMIPLVCLIIAIWLFDEFKDYKFQKRDLVILAISAILTLILMIIIGPEPIIYSSDGLIKSTNIFNILSILICSVPILLSFILTRQKKYIIIVLIAVFLVQTSYLDIKLSFQDEGIKEASAYISSVTNNSEIIIAPKSIGYYSERKYYANDYYKPAINNLSISFITEYVYKSYKNQKMDEEFFYPGGIYGGTTLNKDYIPSQEGLNRASYAVLYYSLKDKPYEVKIGNFYIYSLNK